MFGERSLSWRPDSEGKYRVPDTKLQARLQAIPCLYARVWGGSRISASETDRTP